MNIIITGCLGHIGSYLIHNLHKIKKVKNIYLIDNNLKELENNEYDLIINLDDDYDACKLATKIKHKKIIGAYLDNNKKTYTEDSSPWFDIGLISKFGKEKADELKAQNKNTYPEILYKILDLEYKKQEPILILNNEHTHNKTRRNRRCY